MFFMRARLSDSCARRLAFTLVELLVVIGIIAVLISILLPVLSTVRRQATTARCASNLHGLGMAWLAYCDANRGVCPPGRLPQRTLGAGGPNWESQYRPRWFELLGAQVRRYACPTPKKDEDDTWRIEDPWFVCPAVPEWNNCRNYCYGYNHQFLGNARPKAGASKKRKGGIVWIKYPVRISSIKAATTVMAMDSLGTAAGKPRDQRQAYYPDGTKDLYAVCNKGIFVDPPRMMPDSDYADTEHRAPKHRAGPDARHSGKVNVVFCDAHVQLMSLEELGYAVNPDGSIPISGEFVHNKLFSGTGLDKDPPPLK
jgi:prepilin-type processing-associated H-X9-DG protein/prepilin-type N-terminal cleavage/methylation domain-containing protein